jgi:hypothetical protein
MISAMSCLEHPFFSNEQRSAALAELSKGDLQVSERAMLRCCGGRQWMLWPTQ